jgi:hypothetical protein
MLTEQRIRELFDRALPGGMSLDRVKDKFTEALNTALTESEANLRMVLAEKFNLLAQWHYATADATGETEHVHFAQAYADAALVAREEE